MPAPNALSLGTALRQLAAEAEAYPTQSVDSRQALEWICARLTELATQARPAPALCPRCQHELAARPRGLLN